jgi:hypothetical protein
MIYRHIMCAPGAWRGCIIFNLFFLGSQNSISRGKICMDGRINNFEKVKTTWDLCAQHKHILFLRHLLVYIFSWARVPLCGKFNIGLRKHTLLGKIKLNSWFSKGRKILGILLNHEYNFFEFPSFLLFSCFVGPLEMTITTTRQYRTIYLYSLFTDKKLSLSLPMLINKNILLF